MASWLPLVGAAAASGLVLSIVLTIIMVLSSRVALDMWVDNYPPDVREKYGPMSDRAQHLRPVVATLFFITMLAVPLAGLLRFESTSTELMFVQAFVFGFLTLLTFNLYDLLVLDLLIFSTWQPGWIILPGTEGMVGYGDYRFHVAGFFKGLAFSFVGGLFVALAAALL